jgi:hypothetical protein
MTSTLSGRLPPERPEVMKRITFEELEALPVGTKVRYNIPVVGESKVIQIMTKVDPRITGYNLLDRHGGKWCGDTYPLYLGEEESELVIW